MNYINKKCIEETLAKLSGYNDCIKELLAHYDLILYPEVDEAELLETKMEIDKILQICRDLNDVL